MKKTISMTLFSKIVSIVCMITVFTACGSSYDVGDRIRLVADCPAADSPSNARLLRRYIRKGDNESAMRMFYLGNAGAMDKGSVITIKQKQGDCYQVEYNNDIPFVHWTYKTALDRNGKKVR